MGLMRGHLPLPLGVGLVAGTKPELARIDRCIRRCKDKVGELSIGAALQPRQPYVKEGRSMRGPDTPDQNCLHLTINAYRY